MSVRRLLASCAHVRHRNCANLRSKCARFCVQNFETPHDCGQQRTHKVQKRNQEPFDARCRRCEVFSERKDAFGHEILLSKAAQDARNLRTLILNTFDAIACTLALSGKLGKALGASCAPKMRHDSLKILRFPPKSTHVGPKFFYFRE